MTRNKLQDIRYRVEIGYAGCSNRQEEDMKALLEFALNAAHEQGLSPETAASLDRGIADAQAGRVGPAPASLHAPVFIAVFNPPRRILRNISPGVVESIAHVAYDDTGQRWGYVERLSGGSGSIMKANWVAPKHEMRGWVKLPTQILDEEWKEST